MTGTFACPECGAELTLQGATPGRLVRCGACATDVEVPYLPREGVWTRRRFRGARPSWLIPLGWTAVAIVAIIVAVLAVGNHFARRGRGAREATLASMLKAADQAERAGRNDRALSEIEAALAFLRPSESPDSPRLAALRRRRDVISVREAEGRIEASSTLGPAEAVGDLLSLQARAQADRSLDALAPAIRHAVEAARRRDVGHRLAEARRARDAGRPSEAIAMAEGALIVVDKLEASEIRAATAEAEALIAPEIARLGAIVEQAPGQFTLGSPGAYDATIGPRAAEALRRRGYLPRPTRGPVRPFWDRHAPYRLRYQVTEVQDALYLQSKSRVSEIVAALSFAREGMVPWQDRVTGRTQVPLPDLPAYIGGRLAVADRREPETERRLYENARARLLDQLDGRLQGIPPPSL